MRLLRLITVAAVAAALAVPAAFAFGFTDEALLTPNGVVGRPYSFRLDARNGCPPYTFHVDSGNLPPGLSLEPSGQISGTPSAPGTWKWWGRVTNACPADHSERQLSITVTRPTPAAVRAPSAEAGVPFRLVLFAADEEAPEPFRWTPSTLPEGLQIDNERHRLIGTPLRAGTTTIDVAVSNERGPLTPLRLKLVVARRLAIAPATLADAKLRRPYATRIRTLGGVPPLRWRVARLPRGLRFDPATATLAGTPQRPGAARISVLVRDALGVRVALLLTLRVTR
jgi:hypothetical protein